MPTIINADTATGGAIITGDTSGQLQLQSGGVTALTTNGANVTVAGTFTATGGVTGVNLATGVTGILPVANGGTGATTLTANNVLLGNGTSAVQAVAPGASGNVLTSNGTTWASAAAVSGVQQFTSSGSITAGQAVTLNTDGTVSTVTGTSTSQAVLAENGIGVQAFSGVYNSSVYDEVNNLIVYAMRDGSANMYAGAYRVDANGSVSQQGSAVYLGSSASEPPGITVIKLGTNNFAISYATSSTNTQIRTLAVNTSTLSISGYNSTGLTNASGDAPYNVGLGYDPVSDKLITARKSNSSQLTISVYSPDLSSVTATRNVTINDVSNNSMTAVAVRTAVAGQFGVFTPSSSSQMGFRLYTLNSTGTSISGTDSQTASFTASTNQGQFVAIYVPTVDRYMCISMNYFNQVQASLHNPTTGASITAVNITQGSFDYRFTSQSAVDTATSQVRFAGVGSGVLQYAARPFTADSFGAQQTSTPFLTSYSRPVYTPTGTPQNLSIASWNSQANAVRSITFTVANLTSNAQNFAGFATNTVTTGQSAIVAVPGGVATNRTGLTRNLEYYLNFDGSLVTTPTPFGVVLRATSATGGEVIRPVNARRPVALVSFSNTTAAVIPLGATGFRAIECYYSLSLSSSNNPTVSFTTTSGSTTTLTGTGFWTTGSSSINTSGGWSTLSPVSASSFTGFFSVDSSVAGGVHQGNYGGLGWTANSNSMGAPATQITFSFPVTATSGTIMVYGIPA
jgi:hypothetical protein